MAKSCIIWISSQLNDLDTLIKTIKPDLLNSRYDLLNKSIIIRVPKLPMNSLIEIELICDSIHIENEPIKNFKIDLGFQHFYQTFKSYIS